MRMREIVSTTRSRCSCQLGFEYRKLSLSETIRTSAVRFGGFARICFAAASIFSISRIISGESNQPPWRSIHQKPERDCMHFANSRHSIVRVPSMFFASGQRERCVRTSSSSMNIFFRDLGCRLWFRLLLLVFSIGLMGVGGRIFFQLGRVASGGLGIAIAAAMLFLCGVALFAAGLMLILFPVLTRRVSSAVTGLFLPAAELKEPALMLSPVRGKITAGRFEEALQDLEKLKERYPDHASICLLRADLYAGCLNDPQSAFESARIYLEGEARTPAEDCVQLVLRYTDLCLCGGLFREARECVECELRKSCYSEREKASLRKRLELIRRREEE